MRTPHDATPDKKERVREFVSFGVTQEEIATYLGIDVKTLYKYYRQELDSGAIEANAKVARSLFHKAVIDKDPASMMFWLKTKAKWREKDKDDDVNKSLVELLQIALEAKKD